MSLLGDVFGRLKQLPGNQSQNGTLIDVGVSAAGIPFVKIGRPNKTINYLFLDNTGVLRSHTAEPATATDGSPVTTGLRTIVVDTNGTTPVNILGATSILGGVIKAVTITALDTTAGNIIVKVGANPVVTVAKGVTAGALVGGTTLSNTTLAVGDVFTVESSSAGNARVVILLQLN